MVDYVVKKPITPPTIPHYEVKSGQPKLKALKDVSYYNIEVNSDRKGKHNANCLLTSSLM